MVLLKGDIDRLDQLGDSASGYSLPAINLATGAYGKVTINPSTTELGYIDGITPGTATASKALVVDASTNLSGIGILTGSTLSFGICGANAYRPSFGGTMTFNDAAIDVDFVFNKLTSGSWLTYDAGTNAGTIFDVTSDEIKTFAIPGQIIADISGANAVTFVSPVAGTVHSVHSIVSGDPGAETDIAMTVNGGSAATVVLTIANAAAANEKDSATFADNNVVAVGDYVTLTSDGAATNGVSANMTVILRVA